MTGTTNLEGKKSDLTHDNGIQLPRGHLPYGSPPQLHGLASPATIFSPEELIMRSMKVIF
jgi:hypothetical protein